MNGPRNDTRRIIAALSAEPSPSSKSDLPALPGASADASDTLSAGSTWQALLGVSWPRSDSPKSLCGQSGECCRGAAQYRPWANLLRQAAAGETTARDFLSQFVPYASYEAALAGAPDGVAASLAIVRERGQSPEDAVFYRCRYLEGKNRCRIYEDRPTLCRDFPESPFGAIPACCGYNTLTQVCRQKMDDLKRELAYYKGLQAARENRP